MTHYHTPLVSVCIPTYKNPELLNRCLKSIFEQSYSNFELIITDDSPDDAVAEVVKNYEDSRIKYIKNTTPLGSPENWNEGLRQAKGDYIKIMHHDDWFAVPDALQAYMDEALKSGSDFICANCYNVGPNSKKKHNILNRFKKKWAQDRSLILYANYLGNPSTILFKRPVNDPIFYDKKSIWFVDVLFYYEYTQLHPRISYVNEFLIDTSAGLDTQVTNSAISPKVAIQEFLYVAEKHGLYNKHNFLTKLSLIEILERYHIGSKKELNQLLDTPYNKPLPYILLKLHIHHQVYNVIKHILMLL